MNLIETPRLLLRQWTEEDFEPFAQLNLDPDVMEFFPKKMHRTQEESYALAKDIMTRNTENNWGNGHAVWAVEIPGQEKFIGCIMLVSVSFEATFTPAVEIGWRLAHAFWGNGYATEAAHAVLNFAFETLKLPEVVSFTVEKNIKSRRVMEKLGMHHNPAENFDHPRLEKEDPFCRHVLYRISREEFLSNSN